MKHLALLALTSVATLPACKGDPIGKATKESPLASIPAQVQVTGTIAGRPFTGGTIFVMPEVGDTSLLKTVIYADRSKVQLVCRQVSDSPQSDFYYDHVTIWVKTTAGTYPVTNDDKAQAKVFVENYASEGTQGTLGAFAEPTGSVQVTTVNSQELAMQLDIHGNPQSFKETGGLNDFKLSGSFRAPVCLSN